MAGLVEKDVFRFEIAVDEAHKMKIFQCCSNFGGIEPGIVFCDTFSRPSLQS